MRCPKCGYISFDHLNQCTQCQTDLTGEKLRLNYPDTLPDPISVQEIKERAFGPIRPGDDKTQIAKAYIPSGGTEASLDGEPPSAQKPKPPQPEKPVIEISMEDFDLGQLK
jgi:hypothetical protein